MKFITSFLSLLYTIVLIGSKSGLMAQSEELPSGKGLAESIPSGESLSSHPAVIFYEDFESPDYKAHWDETRDKDGEVLSRVRLEDSGDKFGRSLQVKAALSKNAGGGFTQWFESADPLFIRFYVRFDEECDYVHHMVVLRANRSLQGKDKWSGFGGAGKKPSGDERFSTSLEPWGNWGQWPAPGRWNFYSYWHEMKSSNDGNYWGNSFKPESQPPIPKGRWICAEFMLKHNTPGEPDGEQGYWIDGQLMGHWKGINWRTTPGLKANSFTLETYVTDRWTKNEFNTVYFDDVVIAREYIGPK